jgi:hypothetical protein
MIENNQSLFLLEGIKVNWLETRTQQFLCKFIVWLASGLFLGLIIGLAIWIIFGWVVGIFGAAVLKLLYEQQATDVVLLNTRLREWLYIWFLFWQVVSVATGSIFAIYVGVFGRFMEDDPTRLMQWSGRGLIGKMSTALIMCLIIIWSGSYLYRNITGDSSLDFTWVALIFCMSILGIGFSLDSRDLSAMIGEMRISRMSTTIFPNQAIHQALRSAFRTAWDFAWYIATFFGLIVFTIFFLFSNFSLSSVIKVLGFSELCALFIALFAGPVGWLFFGGLAVISHYVVRLLMSITGIIPWNYVGFLNYCVDRIFLHRVGGGYIFIHRLLMEHFAAMYSQDEK